MKNRHCLVAATILVCVTGAAQIADDIGTPRRIGERSIQLKHGYIWTSFEEGGHTWMVGALKEHASSHDDPAFMATGFAQGYAVKVQSGSETTLHHNCCTTNILIGTNFTGTVQVGTNFFKVSDLLKR